MIIGIKRIFIMYNNPGEIAIPQKVQLSTIKYSNIKIFIFCKSFYLLEKCCNSVRIIAKNVVANRIHL